MRNHLYIALFAAAALTACKGKDPSPPSPGTTEATPAAVTRPATDVAPKKPKVTSPERISEIEASGQTGLWSSVAAVCKGAKGDRTVLTWNVSSSGAERVVVYVIDKNGEERNFGQGGPIGEKETGPWVRAGTTFKIRAKDSKEELGNVLIAEKPC